MVIFHSYVSLPEGIPYQRVPWPLEPRSSGCCASSEALVAALARSILPCALGAPRARGTWDLRKLSQMDSNG